jgi:hypothetical protein
MRYGLKNLLKKKEACKSESISTDELFFLAAALFFDCNGVSFQSTEENVVLKALALAEGAVSETDYAEWLRLSCQKKKKGKG